MKVSICARFKMDTEAFINVMSRKPAIWMIRHPQHKYRKVTNVLWEEIKQEFPDTELNSLRKKWKNLKCTYRKQLKKNQPKWKYFELMSFLKDQFEDESSDPLNVEHNIVVTPELLELSSPEIISVPPSPSPSSTDSTLNCEENSHQLNSSTLRGVRKRPSENIASETQALNVDKKTKVDIIEKQVSFEELTKSDDYFFLMSLLPQIIKLPPIKKLRLRNKFHQELLNEMSASYGKSLNVSNDC